VSGFALFYPTYGSQIYLIEVEINLNPA